MSLSKPLRLLLFGTAGLIGLILVTLVIVSFFRIPINLESQKALLESLASESIARQVSINGKIQVTTSLWPVFIIEDVHIKNPDNFADGNYARLQSARIEIGLIRFLLGKIRIKDVEVNGLELSLQVDEKGAVNWLFNDAESDEPDKDDETTPKDKYRELTSDAIIINRIHLSNISVSYFEPGMEKPSEFIIDTCTGSVLPGEEFKVTFVGTIQEEPYEVTIRAASLLEFLTENRSWLDIETKIAKAHLKFSGTINLAEINRNLKLKLEIKGEELQNLNRLLKLNLPPVPSYGLSASFAAQEGLLELTDLQIFVADSVLTGSMKVDNTGPIPEAALTLHSPLVQINDFVFANWSPFPKDNETAEEENEKTLAGTREKTEEPPGKLQHAGKVLELLSSESLQKINANITVSADKVLSGEDQLGSGQFTASLKDGRINLDPLNLKVPGGSVFMSVSLKPGRENAEGALKVQVKNFDFGIMARRANPATDMGGIINIDVDLTSSAQNFSGLLARGNGYFDFSAKPENLQSGIMDLWAINVISAIVSNAVKGKSHIEYLVGRWTMENGLLESDVLVIDTTRMRICGKGWADFRRKKLELKVAPSPKKPEFFSLATPIIIRGDFEDFGLSISPTGLIGTGIKFVVSPLQVPLQTILDKPVPADSSDIMTIELGPENRDIEIPQGCRWDSIK